MRRGLGRGRFLVAVGSVIALVGMALPWVTVGGGISGLPVIAQNGFDGAGILVFVASILLLALLTLPYASKTGTSSLDRPWSYVGLAGLGVIGLIVQVAGFFGRGQLGFPDHAPGLWITAFGLFVVTWGVGEILGERPAAL
jgi:quinol-cytochrome oxidoreductase complex cytochrome b subunit